MFSRRGPNSGDERGAILFLLWLFLLIFLTAAALAVDLSAIAARGQELQNTADAASLAAVVEYQDKLNEGNDVGTAQAAAQSIVDQIVVQNDIDLADVEVTVDFPAGGDVVTVSIYDPEPDSYLSGAVGFDPEVRRGASAKFTKCLETCNIAVDLPRPVTAISAVGNGDGYKPIRVGDDKIYAINHNAVQQNIVCVSRITQLGCWEGIDPGLGVQRVAYSGASDYEHRNPEMPHTGVVGSRIYWSATDSIDGHLLFCWETETDTPCSQPVRMSDDLRGDSSLPDSLLHGPKDENRGGGTIAYRDKVFVFTDNHEIHCFDPIADSYCAGYPGAYGSRPTALGLANFPANDPADGNHGSSIDRIVDTSTGYIYSTLHIENKVEVISCSTTLEDPFAQPVVIRNTETGAFLDARAADDVRGSPIAKDTTAHWELTDAGAGSVYLRSVGLNAYLDGRESPVGTSPFSNGALDDDEWILTTFEGSVDFKSTNFDGYLSDLGGITKEDTPVSESAWQLLPVQCGDPSFVEPPQPAEYYDAGTWLHCYDTGILSGIPQPCPGFLATRVDGEPGPIHENARRFSGRLFFYYSSGAAAAVELGVCSSGYGAEFATAAIEVNCVDVRTGDFSTSMTGDMAGLASSIRSHTTHPPAAWGDPHWNRAENRLFYPTEHNTPEVICWDFDTGSCGSRTGTVPPNPTGETTTEDYGFFSDEICIYGLGHHRLFWAFDARDINEPCRGAQNSTPIQRCPCGDGTTFDWGELDFSDVDLSVYDVFEVQITTSPKNDADPTNDEESPLPVFPPDGSVISLKAPGASTTIDLDQVGLIPEDLVWIEVKIYIETDAEPVTLEGNRYTLGFPDVPRLID